MDLHLYLSRRVCVYTVFMFVNVLVGTRSPQQVRYCLRQRAWCFIYTPYQIEEIKNNYIGVLQWTLCTQLHVFERNISTSDKDYEGELAC